LRTIVSKNVRAFVELFFLSVRYRTLIVEMARRELTDRYAGQMFGLFWTVGHPLFMMALYVTIFVFVLKTKIGDDVSMKLDYTTYILSGLVPWLSIQESLSKACTAVTSNSNLVKQVIFPIEILPIKTILSAGFAQVISTILLILYVVIYQKTIWMTFLLIPVLMAFQIMMMVGLGFLLASIAIFFRDLKDFVQLFCTVGVYVVPVLYLPQWSPGVFKLVIYANPFSYMVWCYQDAIYYGRFEHPLAWIVFPTLSVFTLIVGYRIMGRLKPIMGDCL